MPTIHVITHTHWDRDWFLTAEYTNPWLDDLFQALYDLVEKVPDYAYVLDGQTLLLEDHLERHPEQKERIRRHANAGNLLLGPYYGQIDWRVASGESWMRNLYFGVRDARAHGNPMPVGWLLDNFGHPGQTPQAHALFGIQDLFVWRGPVFPQDAINSEFVWQGSDGTRVAAHFLVSGYRNFYNLADTVDYVDLRIQQLREMLAPFATHDHLLFLDGYDLDVWPEDPFQVLPEGEGFVRSTPGRYAAAVTGSDSLPVVEGELYSGKYACVFPGSLSARSYLKLENALIERLLAYYLEPLQAVLRQGGVSTDVGATEALWRDLLKTQIHDSIGGVSVDQVHDNMEAAYRTLYTRTQRAISQALRYLPILCDLRTGKYAYLPSPFSYGSLWLNSPGSIYRVRAGGTGVFAIEAEQPAAIQGKSVQAFTWRNGYYTLEATMEGVRLNGNAVGELTLERDLGDTYSADPRPFQQPPQARTTSLRVLDPGHGYAHVRLEREVIHDGVQILTEEELFLNQTPLLEWTLSVDSRGTDYRLRFVYRTRDADSPVFAKMPYEIVQRPRVDTNYFGAETPPALRPVLLAAREIDAVRDFPFQGFVALSQGNHTQALLARGVREYEVDEQGAIHVTLKRSVEWLARTDLQTRVGDAGPTMYVPGARDERRTRFELALLSVDAPVRSPDFVKWHYLFEYGYLVFHNRNYRGKRSSARFWGLPLPWSGVQNLEDGPSLIRVYNPYPEPFRLRQRREATDVFGATREAVEAIAPSQIQHLIFQPTRDAVRQRASRPADVNLLAFPIWPAGPDRAAIDDDRLDELRDRAEALRREQAQARERLIGLSEAAEPLLYHRTRHTVLRLEREILETELSVLLNELRRQEDTAELEAQIHALGRRLNLARRQRRTYDYILSLFENRS